MVKETCLILQQRKEFMDCLHQTIQVNQQYWMLCVFVCLMSLLEHQEQIRYSTIQKIGLANSQKKRTDAEKEHLRRLNLGKKHSDETKLKQSLALKGRPSNPKAIKAMTDKISLDWIVTTPNGQTLQIRNLAQFCGDNGLNYRKMHAVGNGKYSQHKGYRVSKNA